MFEGKTILITGGTGFLGRALTKKILEYKPHSIRIYSRDEVKHHKMQEMMPDKHLRHLIGDVRDYSRLERAMKGVDIVIHAAALKRIDMLEYNVQESIKTNIEGTINVVNACLRNNVEKAVFISTDKACSPINSYGACKFLGERIFVESNYNKGNARTAFVAARYGNVLASTGSIIPFFIEKITNKEKLTLTDNRMTRFFLSVERAVDEVINALQYGVGGEIFIPKLKSLKITDLLEVLQEIYGPTGIETIGIRPGEKIDEYLINEDEITRTYDFKESYIILSQIAKYQNVNYSYLKNKKRPAIKIYSSGDKNNLLTKKEIPKILKSADLLR
ncbi:MAG: SDR family NAD(P)-dependent oxidoreductase [Candidatus Aenigmarchaeota archaeon]|nr:SDR family NAD(P)-dependent oxidoreductase [Candidatus Aenigmarchaeota archaeon]